MDEKIDKIIRDATEYVRRPANFKGTNDAWQCVECGAIWSTSDRLMSPHVITTLPGQTVPVITPFVLALQNAYKVNGLDSALRICPGENARALVLVSKLMKPKANCVQCCTCYKMLNQACCHCGRKPLTTSDAFVNAVEKDLKDSKFYDVNSSYPSKPIVRGPVTITIPVKPSDTTARALLCDALLPEVMGLLNGIGNQLNDAEYELAKAVARYFRIRRFEGQKPE